MYLSLNYQNSFILLSSHIFNTHTDFVANFKKPMKETSKGTCSLLKCTHSSRNVMNKKLVSNKCPATSK